MNHISIEGMDGVGKSTTCKLLAEKLGYIFVEKPLHYLLDDGDDEIILSDALVRNKKQQGYNVYFQTGTDEHGQKIEIKSKEAGMEPQAFVDEKAGEVKRIWDLMDTTYDKFMRTTDI